MVILAEVNPGEGSTKAPAQADTEREWLTLETPNASVCPYCSRAFLSPQALGGHQNAHRVEKNEKMKVFMKKARKASKGKAVISPQPLRMIPLPSMLGSPRGVKAGGAQNGRNFKGKKAVKLLGGEKKRRPRGRPAAAAPKRPRKNAIVQPKGVEISDQTSSTGSSADVVNGLDLELKL